MGKNRKVLSADHARALIKQALGMILGDTTVEAEGTTEIAAIEARYAAGTTKSRPRRSSPR